MRPTWAAWRGVRLSMVSVLLVAGTLSAFPTTAAADAATPTRTASPNPSSPATPPPPPTPSAAPSLLPATTTPALSPSPLVAVLTSDSLQIIGLQSIAVTTFQTAAFGAVKVIELKMTGSNIGGLDLQQPCVSHTRIHTTAAQADATGGLTLDLTAMQVTILGIPVSLDAANLPAGPLALPGVSLPPLPANLGLLTLRTLALMIDAGSMALSQPSLDASAC